MPRALGKSQNSSWQGREERIFPEYAQFAGTLFARMTNSLGYNNHGARWHKVPLCLFLNLKSLTATSRILTSDEHLAFTEHLGKICPASFFCSHSPPPSSALQLPELLSVPQSLPGPCTLQGLHLLFPVPLVVVSTSSPSSLGSPCTAFHFLSQALSLSSPESRALEEGLMQLD